MKVQILRAGIYLDEGLKSKGCPAGAELETKEAYGRSLIQDGLAKEIIEKAPAPKKKVVKAKITPASKKSGTGKPGKPGNPFLA